MFNDAEVRRLYAMPDRARPWLRLNFVASIDGAATIGGLSGGLNDPWDLTVFENLRALSDVVVVAAGTVRSEGYDAVYLPERLANWRREQGWSAHPRLAIVTASGNLDPASPPFEVEGKEPPLVYSTVECSPELGQVAEVVHLPAGAGVDLPAMVSDLVGRGMTQILSEGGPTLFGGLLEAGLVDELGLTISPVLAGGNATRIVNSVHEHVQNMGLINQVAGGAMLFLRYGRTLGPDAPVS